MFSSCLRRGEEDDNEGQTTFTPICHDVIACLLGETRSILHPRATSSPRVAFFACRCFVLVSGQLLPFLCIYEICHWKLWRSGGGTTLWVEFSAFVTSCDVFTLHQADPKFVAITTLSDITWRFPTYDVYMTSKIIQMRPRHTCNTIQLQFDPRLWPLLACYYCQKLF